MSLIKQFLPNTSKLVISCGRSSPYHGQRRPNSSLSGLKIDTQENVNRDDRNVPSIIPVIGLEVHAQLSVNSKLFSQGGNSTNAAPNTTLDLFDIALPGTLPKLNHRALRLSLLTSLGLNCSLQELIHFDRKNYFYADMPAGYQITQFNKPIAKDGFLEFIVTNYHKSALTNSLNFDLTKNVYPDSRKGLNEFVPYLKRSQIKQVQLEQDSAKALHDTRSDRTGAIRSLIDYNRSGVALIEIVFEPDLSSPHEASSLVAELVRLLKALNTCSCEMENGALRVDANVSIKNVDGHEIINSERVELKNLNSLRSLNRGLTSEIGRQAAAIRNGETIIRESRTYDTKSGRTILLREKEDAVDYRYVPEPNIPPINIDSSFVEDIRSTTPHDLPSILRKKLIDNYDLDLDLIQELLDEPGLSEYFMQVMKNRDQYEPNQIVEFLIYVAANIKSVSKIDLIPVDFKVNSKFTKRIRPELVQQVLDMTLRDYISYYNAYEVIKYVYVTNDSSDLEATINDFGWMQINDDEEIARMCKQLIRDMRHISKTYSKRGQKKQLWLMINKLLELSGNRISVPKAIQTLDKILQPNKS